MPVEDALSFVAEHIQTTIVDILQGGQQRVPPRVGEILRFIDDDRVEAMSRRELCCQIGHLEWQIMFPEPDGVVVSQGLVRSLRRTPLDAESMELADIGRLLAARPGRRDAFEVGG